MAQSDSNYPPLGIRWTIGDVSDSGFEALQLSAWSAHRLFGDSALYTVCVNSISVQEARRRAGELPSQLRWMQCDQLLPAWITPFVNPQMAEGVAWKLAPVRIYPDRYELSLDNDIILWDVPPALTAWLLSPRPDSCLMAADVAPAFGQFDSHCSGYMLNSGIRGLPPGFDYEAMLRRTLTEARVHLSSELDEQGLQAAVLSRTDLHIVPVSNVSICSPFPNHQQHLGTCGAHFVGLNPKHMFWTLEGRGAHEVIRERWLHFRDELRELARLPVSSTTSV